MVSKFMLFITIMGIIIGVASLVFTITFGILSLNDQENPQTITISTNDDLKKFELDRDSLDHYDSHKPYQLVWTHCGLSHTQDRDGNTIAWELHTTPKILDKDSNNALISFNGFFWYDVKITDGSFDEKLNSINNLPTHFFPVRGENTLQIDMTQIFEEGKKLEPGFVMLTLDKSKFTVFSEISNKSLTDWDEDSTDRIFAEFVYHPNSDKWVLNDSNKDSICENLYQK